MRRIELFFVYGFLYGLPFGLITGLLHIGYSENLFNGLIVGITTGAIYGSFMAIAILLIEKARIKKYIAHKEFLPFKDEIIFDSYTYRISGFFVTVGGWLFLTKTALIFVKKDKNGRQPIVNQFKLDAIDKVKKSRYRLNPIPNVLSILIDAKEEKFAFASIEKDKIVNAKVWMNLIQNK